MDILAALALIMVIEGLALVIFAKSLPALLCEIETMGPAGLRRAGVLSICLGALMYLGIRGG